MELSKCLAAENKPPFGVREEEGVKAPLAGVLMAVLHNQIAMQMLEGELKGGSGALP